jgi:hypothetical protein
MNSRLWNRRFRVLRRFLDAFESVLEISGLEGPRKMLNRPSGTGGFLVEFTRHCGRCGDLRAGLISIAAPRLGGENRSVEAMGWVTADTTSGVTKFGNHLRFDYRDVTASL